MRYKDNLRARELQAQRVGFGIAITFRIGVFQGVVDDNIDKAAKTLEHNIKSWAVGNLGYRDAVNILPEISEQVAGLYGRRKSCSGACLHHADFHDLVAEHIQPCGFQIQIKEAKTRKI